MEFKEGNRNLDFNGDGKVDLQDYEIAKRQLDYSPSSLSMSKEELKEAFSSYIEQDFSFSYKDVNSTFHFYEDKNGNGVVDDKSELLGFKNGLNELLAYDLNGDGKIDGEELERLKVLKVDDISGEKTYMTALQAGIKEINLSAISSWDVTDTMEEFSIDVKTLDGLKKIILANADISDVVKTQYAGIFIVPIADYKGNINDVSYMRDFVEEMTTIPYEE